MQRDLKFVRDILQHVADETPPAGGKIKLPLVIPGYQYPERRNSIYHGHRAETDFLTDLCIEAGFFKTVIEEDQTYIVRLTWQGYDMLDKLGNVHGG